jgi:signal transduction histidine kinase
MFGLKRVKRLIRKRLIRYSIALTALLAFGALGGVIAYAVYDLVSELRHKEQVARSASLKTELAQFVLALRDEDGFPLLDNLDRTSRENRSIAILQWSKPLFTYFLQDRNIRTFQAANLRWESPRSCTVEFTAPSGSRPSDLSPFRVRVCMAVVPSDAAGRYIYFSLQYPDDNVVVHRQGEPLARVDRVVLAFVGERPTKFDLVYETPRVLANYPSLAKRLGGIHDVTAYASGVIDKPVRGVHAQAFERFVPDEDGRERNLVTVVGRVDAGLIWANLSPAAPWPPARLIKEARVELEILNTDSPAETARSSLLLSQNAKGRAIRSVEQVYASTILSKAKVEISATQGDQATGLWSSSELAGDSPEQREVGWVQTVSDSLTKFLLSGFPKTTVPTVMFPIEGRTSLVAKLQGGELGTPDVAARAFLYVSVSAVLLLVLVLLATYVFYGIGKISRMADSMTKLDSRRGIAHRAFRIRHELKILAETFDVLLRRSAQRGQLIGRLREEEMRLAQERIRARQSLLDAIGHEIRSPLQTLSTHIEPHNALFSAVQRMVRAVDALFGASSIEAAFREGKLLCKIQDLGAYLTRLVQNLKETGAEIEYDGPVAGVMAWLDPVSFETVFDHIRSNAERHKNPGSNVTIRLIDSANQVAVEIANQGESIPTNQLETIFNLGVSTAHSPKNQGLGLYAVRSYILGMRGSVHAENRPGGVAFVITLSKTARLSPTGVGA